MRTETLTGLTARETWGRLAARHVPTDQIAAFMVEAWAGKRAARGGTLLESLNPVYFDGPENATYRITA